MTECGFGGMAQQSKEGRRRRLRRLRSLLLNCFEMLKRVEPSPPLAALLDRIKNCTDHCDDKNQDPTNPCEAV